MVSLGRTRSSTIRIRDLVSGTDSVAAVQSGAWNITNISGTVSLPTGASTLAEQQTQTTALQLIDDAVHATNGALSKTVAIGGHLDDTATTAATENNVAPVRITAQRGMHANLRNDAGTEVGTAGAPIRVDTTGTTTQPVSGTVTANQGGTWNVNNISGTVSLPTGAATLVEQQTQTTALQLIDDIAHATNAALSKTAAIGGQLDDTGTTAATENNVAPVRITAQRALHSNLRNDAGTEVGTSGAPIRTDPTGTTAQPITDNAGSLTIDAPVATPVAARLSDGTSFLTTTGGRLSVDGSGGTQPVSGTVTANAGSGTFGTQDTSSLVDNAAFTDGTSRVLPIGYVFDDVAGTALTENDIAAGRVDSKRAIVHVIEDGTTRGQKAAVSAAGRISVDASGIAVPVTDNASSLTVDAPVGTPLASRLSDGTAFLTTTGGRLAVDGSGVTQPISGTVTATQATAANFKAQVQGEDAHDAAITGNPTLVGAKASAAAPADVSADNDAVRVWALRNGSQVVNLAAGGALITGDGANGLDIDVTRLPALVAGSANIGDVDIASAPTGTSAIQTQGTAADGAAAVGNPVQVAGKDGSGNAQAILTDTTGAIVEPKSGTATRTQVADSATDVSILASNTARLGACVFNDSSAILFLGLSATAVTTTNYTVKLFPNSYYEVPARFTGELRGIWATDPGDGAARVTELT